MLGAGTAAGVAAGVVYLWNDGRYDRWRAADQQLSVPPTGAPMDWLDRQRQNDELLRSIQRVDTIDTVVAAAAVACVLGSALLGVLINRPHAIEPDPAASRSAGNGREPDGRRHRLPDRTRAALRWT